MIDDGEAVHYAAVKRGTPVYSSDEVEVGAVEVILDNYREHIFDGVAFTDSDGVLRFADAPEVGRTAQRGVTLTLSADEAAQLPPPDKGHPSFRPSRPRGRLGRMFGGGWKRH
ncbi:MAG: hypothetical protein ACRDKV_01590 [Solirubrobacterales bacterium]